MKTDLGDASLRLRDLGRLRVAGVFLCKCIAVALQMH